MRGVAILVTAAAIYSGAHDAAGTDFGPKCRYSSPITFNSRHFNYDQLHDVLQCSGGELSNRLLHSRAARGHARRNCDLEPDGKHGVRNGLHFKPARVSDHMRERLPVPIASPLPRPVDLPAPVGRPADVGN